MELESENMDDKQLNALAKKASSDNFNPNQSSERIPSLLKAKEKIRMSNRKCPSSSLMSYIEEKPESAEYTYEKGEENIEDELDDEMIDPSKRGLPFRYNLEPNTCWIRLKSGRQF